MSLKVQQTPRKGTIDVVKERFKEAHRRRDAGDASNQMSLVWEYRASIETRCVVREVKSCAALAVTLALDITENSVQVWEPSSRS